MAGKEHKKTRLKDLPLSKKVSAKDLKAIGGGKKPGKKAAL